ncbi:antimicrobial ginkbilobin-2-like protein [Lolium perenne]|uniref:antimicrobial ginkbilobin-2-like protein n=1 Tax=Lolium perenne TaxID=4522 RepID=UPI003A98FAE6
MVQIVRINFLVLVTASSATSELSGSLLKCYQAPPGTNNTALFAEALLPLLGALPSVAAPTGFASLRSGGTSRDRAFARALCFGDSTPPADCLRCLSDAARNVTAGCGTSRLAGIWTDGCFVAYGTADTSADAFRSRAIISLGSDVTRVTNASEPDLRRLADVALSLAPRAAANGPRMLATADATAVSNNYAWRSTVRVLAQCARDRAPAECLRCLQGSAREVGRCCWGLDPWRGGVAAAVVGFDCYLRFEVATAKVALPELIWLAMKDNPVFVVVCFVATFYLAAVLAVLVLITRANKMKPALQALEEEIAALQAQIKAVHLQLAAQTN